ncbi:fungal specific transcription factor domain-containing protein [Colletotrichum graminicola]|uniref:Fungal specific transcription factor domain-containing protein n=1 Tax=Colletotrichum graminicola (strain M1.001 / M2 / FGSC 10212) TaxID=645133 RepID=E3QKK7_COLGM|nr:fungal specific transcription factor domain-containing protein [Colletotrichum graminicola M1.001]EFQ31395.1 fungal specific transcription factor domain-containing protein [Colletotrichum graminicola M1.001]WDK19673.1 fungal specific transcription factor domain-containing protein [Colletotrichum graminicola]
MQQQQPDQTENTNRASRLPVNPRRHKVAPDQRKRVATACNSCNVRRIKCSGERPCRQCRSSSRDCQYPTVIEKISISRNELDDLRRKLESTERALQAAVPDDAARRQLLQHDADLGGSRAGSNSSFTPPQQQQQQQHATPFRKDDFNENPFYDTEAEAAEGRQLEDQDGRARFLGETSGATFLDHLKEFMTTISPLAFNKPWLSPTPNNGSAFLASLGRYQTYDSRPIEVESNADPLVLPSRADMSAMLSELRYFIQDGSGLFPCGGIYWWGDLNCVPVDPKSVSLPPETPHQAICHRFRHLAFYHVAFAVACQASTTATSVPIPRDLGQDYFARARMLLGNPLDITQYTISDVAVLALMGFYLIEMNRRDAAYMYVSNAMHISIMHGAHRGWVDERGKRVFWTLYILDRWLSCLMGRPPTIMDDAIRLPLPCDAPSLPPAAGLRAHVLLARISGHIVCNTYKVAPWDRRPGEAARHVDRALQLLDNWYSSLPPTLQMSATCPSTDPACCLLHMAYNQLLILVVRPIFFAAVKKAFAERYIQSDRRWDTELHADRISTCSEAAHRNLYIARWLLSLTGGSSKLLQAGLHYVFNAAIVLMLEDLLSPNLVLPSTESDDIKFAIGVFEEEAKTGSHYGHDCATVLQDLKSLVQRLRVDGQGASSARTGGPATPGLPPDDATIASNSNTPTRTVSRQPEQPTFSPGPTQLHSMDESGPLYQELMTWMDNSDMQLYSTNYSI